MIPETSVNWKAFEYKFSDNPQSLIFYEWTIVRKPNTEAKLFHSGLK